MNGKPKLLTPINCEGHCGISVGLREPSRRDRTSISAPEVVRLQKPRRGTLKSLALHPELRAACGPDQIRVKTLAAGLNFRDVLSALNRYPGDPGPLGAEFAGIVIETGPNVASFLPGFRVAGVAPGAFASELVVSPETVCALPPDLHASTAAGLPVAYL